MRLEPISLVFLRLELKPMGPWTTSNDDMGVRLYGMLKRLSGMVSL